VSKNFIKRLKNAKKLYYIKLSFGKL